MVDEFLGPLRELIARHQEARDAAQRAVHALRNQPEHAELYTSVSKAHARLVAEHDKLAHILGQAKQLEVVAAQDALNSLEALMPPPGALGDIGLPQPEDLGFDVAVDFEDEATSPETHELSGEPTHPGHPAAPAPAAPAGPSAPAGLDDLLQAFVSGDDVTPAPPAAPANAAPGDDKKAWLDAMLSDFVNEDRLAGKRVRSTARLRAYRCQGLEEVQISGLVTHAPRTVFELVRLSNLDEASVRATVESFVARGLVELI